jgi:hypothetical protein
MERQMYSMPVGIVTMAFGCLVSTACVDVKGLELDKTDAGRSDAGGKGGGFTTQGGASGSRSAGGEIPMAGGGTGGSKGGSGADVNTGKPDAGGSIAPPPDAKPGKETGKPDAQAVPDSSVRRDSGVSCGPVCAIYCQYGNVLDTFGCPTCVCNSGPTCPAIKCKACTFGYLKDANGCQTCTCATDPSLPCNQLFDLHLCEGSSKCRWLEPGCGTPALAAAGCYDQTAVGCTASTDCADNRSCMERVINPCANTDCNACGSRVNICL